MLHLNVSGTHYEAGFQCGSWLKARGCGSAAAFVFPRERRDYALAALKVYEREYPEMIDEIRGLAEGLEADFMLLSTFLLGMYAYNALNFCTCAAMAAADGHTLFGRNSDFLTALEPGYGSYFYRLKGCHGFIGTTTAFAEMEDGVNDAGLAVGLTYVYSPEKAPGLNSGMLVRRLLERCATLEECLDSLEGLTVGSSQTLTIADRGGAMAVVECSPRERAVIRPADRPFVCTTNHFNRLKSSVVPPAEEDMFSARRYETARKALSEQAVYDVDFLKDLLSGKKGFMCQYDRRKGGDTVWSVICDLTGGELLRCEGNPSRGPFERDVRMIF